MFAFSGLVVAVSATLTLVLIGWVLRASREVTAAHADGIGRLTSRVSMPALLCLAMATLDPSADDCRFLLAFALAKVAVFAATTTLSYLTHSGPRSLGVAALRGIAATQSNDFALGVPVVSVIFPDHLRLLFLTGIIQLAVINPAAFWMMELCSGSSDGLLPLAARVAASPPISATIAGAALNVIWRGSPPACVTAVLQPLASAFAAGALLNLGGSLHGKSFDLFSETSVAPLLITFVKMVVLPLALAAAVAASGAAADSNVDLCVVALMIGTLPTAPNVFLFALDFGLPPDETATAVLLSTAAAAPVTLTAAAFAQLSAEGWVVSADVTSEQWLQSSATATFVASVVSASCAAWLIGAQAGEGSALDVQMLSTASLVAGAAPLLTSSVPVIHSTRWAARITAAAVAADGALRQQRWRTAAEASARRGGVCTAVLTATLVHWLLVSHRAVEAAVEVGVSSALFFYFAVAARSRLAGESGPFGDVPLVGDCCVMLFHAISSLVSFLVLFWALCSDPHLPRAAALSGAHVLDTVLLASNGAVLWLAYELPGLARDLHGAADLARRVSGSLRSGRLSPSDSLWYQYQTPQHGPRKHTGLLRLAATIIVARPDGAESALQAAAEAAASVEEVGGWAAALRRSSQETSLLLLCEGPLGAVAEAVERAASAVGAQSEQLYAACCRQRSAPFPFEMPDASSLFVSVGGMVPGQWQQRLLDVSLAGRAGLPLSAAVDCGAPRVATTH